MSVTDIEITLWLNGGVVGGQISGRIIEGAMTLPPSVEEVYQDDFNLVPDDRDPLLAEAYEFIGRVPDSSEGQFTDPFDFERWLSRRWLPQYSSRLCESVERTIHRMVPESLATGNSSQAGESNGRIHE